MSSSVAHDHKSLRLNVEVTDNYSDLKSKGVINATPDAPLPPTRARFEEKKTRFKWPDYILHQGRPIYAMHKYPNHAVYICPTSQMNRNIWVSRDQIERWSTSGCM